MNTLRMMFLVLTLAASLADAAEPLRVHLTGKSQDFHQAQESLISLAAELRDRYGAKITVTPPEKSPDFPALDEADVLVLYVRYTKPPPNVLQRVKDWCAAGKPVVALRSTSRPFLNWPEFDSTVLGCRYASHSKDVPVVTLSVPASATKHPVLAGVNPWESRCARMVHYYFDNFADNTQVLLTGTDGAKSQPTAWVRTPKNNFRGRVFYTSIGLPEDFKEPNYRRLLINAIFWVADRPVPVLSDGIGTTSTKPAPEIKTDENDEPQPRKDLSAMKHHSLTLTGLLALGLAVPTAFGGEPLPYGHADFVPTSERPMIFRAGGNGYYPGATPPTEWSEGTPVQVDMKTTSGNPPKEVVRKVWDFADTKSKNILWKVPVPGWGYAHPIVVRDRVISLGSPHFVTCYDLKTGKQLWQREALPLLCEGQPEDKARAVQVAIDLAMAIRKWGANEGQPFALVTLFHEKKGVAEGFQERAAKISRMLAKYRPAVEKIGDPDLLTALDADLALTTTWEKTTDAVQMLTELGKKGPQSKLCAVVESKYGVPPTNTWSGYVGFSDSAPASDGERVYAVFGQGQVVCYDLEGRLVWAHRSVMTKGQARNAMGAGFSRVPLLVGDRLIVRDEGYQKRSLCFDARTGKILWTYPWGKTGGMLIGHSHLRLNGPDGAPVDVIIMSEEHKIVRLSDGKELGEFRAEKKAPAYNILAWDDTDTIVVGGKSTSGPTEPSACYRIKMTGPDSATGEVVYELAGNPMTPMNLFTATDTHIFALGGGIYDRKTGAKVGQVPGRQEGASSVIAGHYLITQGVCSGPYGRSREDNMATGDWQIFDISDPAKPRLVNQGPNLLGYKDPPTDYIVKTYLAEFDPFLFAGCYKGTPSWFGTDLAGVVPHGNKLLIQSSAFLYCIGEK